MMIFISGIPIDLRGFLMYAGCNVNSYTQEDRVKKTKLLDFIATKITILSKSIPEVTGTDRILRSRAMQNVSNFEFDDQDNTKCNKDTTGLVTMNTYSRGHLFFVTSGGFIRYWSPLYRSESTSQVAIPTIKYLELYMREYENIDNTYLFYDNMVKYHLKIEKLSFCHKLKLSNPYRVATLM